MLFMKRIRQYFKVLRGGFDQILNQRVDDDMG